MSDAAALARAVAGVEGVLHCAATTSQSAPDEALSRRVNVEGTRLLYEAARKAGVGRWIQISSMSAHPGSTTVYGRTKLAADEYLRIQAGPPAWTILRRALFYGPGERGVGPPKTRGVDEKADRCAGPRAGERTYPAGVRGRRAGAALGCWNAPRRSGKTYMIGGGDEMELSAFMLEMVRGAGLETAAFHTPAGSAGVDVATGDVVGFEESADHAGHVCLGVARGSAGGSEKPRSGSWRGGEPDDAGGGVGADVVWEWEK